MLTLNRELVYFSVSRLSLGWAEAGIGVSGRRDIQCLWAHNSLMQVLQLGRFLWLNLLGS